MILFDFVDKLWRLGLFYKLIKRLSNQDWLILKQYYENSNACIENNNKKSELFRMVNGVKQEGILSPFLFNIFIDELIESC